MIEVNTPTLLQIIGEQHVELLILRRRLADVENREDVPTAEEIPAVVGSDDGTT